MPATSLPNLRSKVRRRNREIRFSARSGHHQLASSAVRSRRSDSRRRSTGIRSDLSPARLGRAQSRTDCFFTNRSRSRSSGQSRPKPRAVAAIGIANQRETTIVWNRDTGQPVYNAIVWQDRRTADFCERLRSEGHGPLIQQRTGLLIDSYFSASKISWILDNVSGARSAAEAGKLAFGTVDSWLVWKLTGGRVHATDASNASRTMLFNIHTGSWDHELLDLFRIPLSMMPEVRSSSEILRRGDRSERIGYRSTRGHCGRSASRAVRPAMHSPRPDQEHLRHGMLHAAEHRHARGAVIESAGHDRRLENKRCDRVRARRQRLRGRRRRAVAARRSGSDPTIQ